MTTNEIAAILGLLGNLAMIICWVCLLVFAFKMRRIYKRRESLWRQADAELNAIRDLPSADFYKALEEWHQKYKNI